MIEGLQSSHSSDRTEDIPISPYCFVYLLDLVNKDGLLLSSEDSLQELLLRNVPLWDDVVVEAYSNV